MNSLRKIHILIIALLSCNLAHADAGLSRPDAHAPISVMGEHTHKKGEWMLSYRYMNMKMDGNRDGSQRLSAQSVYDQGFSVAPLDMTMEMHMLGSMYAPTDRLTLMAMLPIIDLTMDHQVTPNASMPALANREFTTTASGVGDIKLGGLYSITGSHEGNLIANVSLSIPTGSIDEEDVLADPAMGKLQMPYPMQLGSGTYDVITAMTYTALMPSYSWGTQAKATTRVGKNDNDYTLGNRYQASAWAAKPINHQISLSARINHEAWEDVDGADNALSPMLVNAGNGTGAVPTLRPDLRAGNRTDLGFGVNVIFKGQNVKNHRIALEILTPVQQHLDGPQLETDWSLQLGYQVAL